MLGSEQIRVGLADQVRRIPETEPSYHSAVYFNKPALRILEIDVIRQVVHERLQEKSLLCESRLHFGVLSRRPGNTVHTYRLSLLITIHLRSCPECVNAAIG